MPPFTGRVVAGAGKRIAQNFIGGGLGLEVFYSFIIIVCSLMIYRATKELYELSSHKGIKYFRLAFLYFAIAYFFRSFIKFFLVYFNVGTVHQIGMKTFGVATLFIFLYFSSMAIFYLLYSVMWKKFDGQKGSIIIFHFLALIVSLIIVSFRSLIVYLIVNVILLLIVLLTVGISRNQHKKKKSGLHVIYILLSVFWVLNILDILIPDAIRNFQLFIYLASTGIFLMIVYRVLRKAN
jgi:hypothetical protein